MHLWDEALEIGDFSQLPRAIGCKCRRHLTVGCACADDHSWTLIDFGCAAREGDTAPIQYTLLYAAPEVVQAHASGQSTMPVSGALDVWSLGVLAYELLMRQPVFAPSMSRDTIVAALTGSSKLPWETASRTELRALLGLKSAIMQCLQRRPEKRPSAQDLVGALEGVFAARTSTLATTVYGGIAAAPSPVPELRRLQLSDARPSLQLRSGSIATSVPERSRGSRLLDPEPGADATVVIQKEDDEPQSVAAKLLMALLRQMHKYRSLTAASLAGMTHLRCAILSSYRLSHILWDTCMCATHGSVPESFFLGPSVDHTWSPLLHRAQV